MTRVLALLIVPVLALGLAFAQEPAQLTLDKALELAYATDADLHSAETTLTSARSDLARSEADPLSLRLDLVQARQAVAAAEIGLRTERTSLTVDVTNAYVTALESFTATALAEAELTLAKATLEAQLVRLDAGAITQLDAQRARNDHDAAQRSLVEAQTAGDLALAQLVSLVGSSVDALVPLEATDATLPPLEDVVGQALAQHSSILAAERAVELAAARLETVDNAFSSRLEIQSARDGLANAESSLTELRRTLELSLRSTYNSALAAVARVESARASLAASAADLAAQRARYQAGSISGLTLQQSEISHATSESSLASAQYALYLALLRVTQAITG